MYSPFHAKSGFGIQDWLFLSFLSALSQYAQKRCQEGYLLQSCVIGNLQDLGQVSNTIVSNEIPIATIYTVKPTHPYDFT